MNERSPAIDVLIWAGTSILVAGLPLLGIVASGRDPMPYLEMPPVTRFVPHAPFSWSWFLFFTFAAMTPLAVLWWAIGLGYRRATRMHRRVVPTGRFPWWGIAGLFLCALFWLLAWTRFTWFRLLQPHTFLPIWVGFILFINAMTVKRSGRCLLLDRPLSFLLLFPVSAVFWWFFEYLNRFVQNWYYTGIPFMGPGEYAYYSSLAFTTVLPGVMSMIDMLLTFPSLNDGLARLVPIRLPTSPWIAPLVIVFASAGLTLIGIFPDQLFALLWVSPLFIILSFQRLAGRPTLLHPLRFGDVRPLVVPALAALICGFFWEMWNVMSLSRWSYTLPYVQRFHIFEMPVLGYGGYLPFGLVCFQVASIFTGDPVNKTNSK